MARSQRASHFGMNNIATEAAPTTRARVWFDSITVGTRGVLVTCVAVYVLGLLTGYDDLGQVCLNPAPVLERWQIYRFLTSAIFHVGILHLVFNMMAFVPIGTSLERGLGSVQFLWLIVLLCVLGDLAYIAVAYLGSYVPISFVQSFWYQCAVGFSGVVFGLIVVDNHVSGASTRSIFGFFTVPAKAYPYALLVFWQLLVPQASFLGHLSGVLIGQLYVWGYLRWAMLSNGALQRVERSLLFAYCYHSSGFIAYTGAGGGLGEQLPLTRPATPSSPSSPSGSGWLRGVWMPYPANLNPWQRLDQQATHLHSPPSAFTTGGSEASGSGVSPLDPKAAAAAAAEARLARATGAAGPAAPSSTPNLGQKK